MSFLKFEVNRPRLAQLGVKGRNLQRSIRAALTAMGRAWHDRYLPLHFEVGAFARYGYVRRKGMGMDLTSKAFKKSYTWRKLRKYHHSRPLVFSGEGQQLARLLTIRATSKQARVILPRKYNLRNPHSRVNMREEITRILPGEAVDLIQVARREFKEDISKPVG